MVSRKWLALHPKNNKKVFTADNAISFPHFVDERNISPAVIKPSKIKNSSVHAGLLRFHFNEKRQRYLQDKVLNAASNLQTNDDVDCVRNVDATVVPVRDLK